MTATPHQFECIVDLWLAGREPRAITLCTGIPARYVNAAVARFRMKGRDRVARAWRKADRAATCAEWARRQDQRAAS